MFARLRPIPGWNVSGHGAGQHAASTGIQADRQPGSQQTGQAAKAAGAADEA